MYYFKLYDANGNELLGSDGIKRIDGRVNKQTELDSLSNSIKRQYLKWLDNDKNGSSYIRPRAKFAAIFKGESILRSKQISDKIEIHNLY